MKVKNYYREATKYCISHLNMNGYHNLDAYMKDCYQNEKDCLIVNLFSNLNYPRYIIINLKNDENPNVFY